MRWRFQSHAAQHEAEPAGRLLYNSLGIPIAAGILWPLTGTLLNPVVAGAAMALSSITVVSNANRLLRFKPKD